MVIPATSHPSAQNNGVCVDHSSHERSHAGRLRKATDRNILVTEGMLESYAPHLWQFPVDLIIRSLAEVTSNNSNQLARLLPKAEPPWVLFIDVCYMRPWQFSEPQIRNFQSFSSSNGDNWRQQANQIEQTAFAASQFPCKPV